MTFRRGTLAVFLQPGVGEILYTESGADDSLYSPPQSAESQHTEYEGFDAKEDDDYLPDTEVMSLHDSLPLWGDYFTMTIRYS